MPRIVPLPESVRTLLSNNTHPRLMLDKYVESWDPDAPARKLSEAVQRPAVDAVATLSRKEPDGLNLAGLLTRRSRMLDRLLASRFRATTTGPLTLHLARASALENAGICLHPIYGFVHLPGSGLKGMAHAFACEVWLPAQDNADRAANWQKICAVFGWAPSPWLRDLAKRHQVVAPSQACAGALVFHDAWPEKWPPLIVDILNSHHNGYYQKNEPPGDWDDPVPVYFLAVPAGHTFTFAVSKRRDDVPDDLLVRAREWLAGALVYLGAGAKTATGYGSFRVEDNEESRNKAAETWQFACDHKDRAEFSATLELVTPAFLAGASQQAEDCDLRPATLRGLLRWWWRTLHVGFVSTADLKRMEAAIWGDTEVGGAVRVTVEADGLISPLRFDRQSLSRLNQLPDPPNRKTTQGLTYHSFGMDDNKTDGGVKIRTQRWYIAPGARWRIKLTARPGTLLDAPVGAVELLGQARAALTLLCRFGGVGAKGRKGFGSLADLEELAKLDLPACKKLAASFREEAGLGKPSFDVRRGESPCLEEVLPWQELKLGWTNYWLGLDQLGDVTQRFAQRHKHRREKQALGLPRKIGHPANGQFRPGRHVKERHASPVCYHFGRDAKGSLVLRVTAFPAKELPDAQTSRQFLGELLDFLRAEVPKRIEEYAERGKKAPVNNPPVNVATTEPTSAATRKPLMPKPGDRVKTVLAEEKTKAGGWKARHEGTGLIGSIINTGDVPADKKAGDEVELIVVSDNPKNASFRCPTATDAPKPLKPSGGKPPPRGGRR